MPVMTAILIIIGVALIIMFGWRALRDYRRLEQRGLTPGTTNVEAIRGWMTLPYIAQAYGVPQQALYEQLGIPEAGNQDLSIVQIAEKYGRDAAEIRSAVQRAVDEHITTPIPEPSGTPP